MKIAVLTSLACLSLALMLPDNALAAKKAAVMTKCTTGQICAANCNNMGWCSRMTCVDGKWTRRMIGCFGSFCGPKCS